VRAARHKRRVSLATDRARPPRIDPTRAPRVHAASQSAVPSPDPSARGAEPLRLEVDLAPSRGIGLRLAHPVLVAAGGAGYGSELLEAVGELRPGAIVTRSITRGSRHGARPPRMVAQPGGLLWSLGVPNPGLDGVLRRHAVRWAGSPVPVIVSICADSAEDIGWLVRRLDLAPEVAGLELNLAGPDRSREGRPIGLDVEASELATVTARASTDLPLIVKLSAVAPDVREIARAVAAAGADAISAIAPLPGVALDAARGGPALPGAYGGLSGRAIKPIGLRVVYEVAQVVSVPLIGIGGVVDLDDVLDYLAAGATAVGLATGALADPSLPGRLGRELAAWCAVNGVTDVRQLVGAALPRRRDRGSLRGGPWRL
jgi:dihydroorotate dehydrogenase (NAD+) catalytic subunit